MCHEKFISFFLRLCELLPLCSAVCCQFFKGSQKTATSGNVESNFKVTKQCLDDIIPCSVDKFVHAHIDMIEGQVIEASQHYIKFINENDELDFDQMGDLGMDDGGMDDGGMDDGGMDYGGMDDAVDVSDDSGHMDLPVLDSACPACKDGNFPTGAHKCILCSKNVHVLPECSESCGEAEGYGEIGSALLVVARK